MGLSIEKNTEAVEQRQSDLRGYIDSDIPLLESFGILKSGESPDVLALSPEDYRTFINWLINGPARPVPSIPLRILCFYRSNLKKSMDDFSTTDGNRLKQENLIKTIDEMLRNGDDNNDPIEMCASGGQSSTKDSCCSDLALRFVKVEQALTALLAKPQTAATAASPVQVDLSGAVSSLQASIQTAIDELKGTVLVGMTTDLKDTLSEIRAMKTQIDALKQQNRPTPQVPGPQVVQADLEALAEEARRKLTAASEKAAAAKAALSAITANPQSTPEEISDAADAAESTAAEAKQLHEEAEAIYDRAYPNSSSSSSRTGPNVPQGVIVPNVQGGQSGGRQALPQQNESLLTGVNTAVKNLKRNVESARRSIKNKRDIKQQQYIALLEEKLNQLLTAHSSLTKAVQDKLSEDDLKEKARLLEVEANLLESIIADNLKEVNQLSVLFKDTVLWLTGKINTMKKSLAESERKLKLCKPIISAVPEPVAPGPGPGPGLDMDTYNTLKAQYDSSVKEIDRLNALIQQLETKSGNDSAEAERVKNQVDQQLKDAEINIKDLEGRLNTMTKNWSNAELQIKQLDNQLINASASLRAAARVIIGLKVQMVGLLTILSNLPSEPKKNTTLQDNYNAALSQIDILAAEIQRLETAQGDKNADSDREITRLNEEIAAAQEQVKQLTTELQGMTSKWMDAEGRIQVLETQLNDTKVELAERTLAFKQRTEEWTAERERAEKCVSNVDDLIQQINNINAQLDKKTSNSGAKTFEIEQLNAELQDLRDKLTEATKQLDTATRSMTSNASELGRAQQLLEDAQATITENQKEITQLRTNVVNRSQNAARAEQSHDALQRDLDKYVGEVEVAFREQSNTIDGFTAQLIDKDGIIAALRQKLVTLQEAKESLQTRFDNEVLLKQSLLDEKNALTEQLEGINGELELVQEQLAAKNREATELANQLAKCEADKASNPDQSERISELSLQLASAQAEVDEAGVREASLIRERDAAIQRATDLSGQLIDARRDLDEAVEEIERLTNEEGTLREQLAQKDAEAVAANNALLKVQEELRDKTAEYAEKLADLQKNLSASVKQVKSLTGDKEAAATKIASLEADIAKLTSASSEIGPLQNKVNELTARLEQVTRDLDTEKLRAEQLISQVSAIKAGYLDEIRKLDTEVRRLNGENDLLRKRLEEAKSLVKELHNAVVKQQTDMGEIAITKDTEIRQLQGQLEKMNGYAGLIQQNKAYIAELEGHLRGLQEQYGVLSQEYTKIERELNTTRKAKRNSTPSYANTTRKSIPVSCIKCNESRGKNRGSCAECDHVSRIGKGEKSYPQQFGITGQTRGGKRGSKGAKLKNFSRKVKPLV